MTKRRVSGLTTSDFFRLNHACSILQRQFPSRTYLVGSSVNAEKDGVYRDIDIRTILDDEVWDEMFDGRPDFWGLFCLGMSTYLAQVSGLPIDYQVQRMTEANERFAGPRNPIGVPRHFAGAGDATGWTASSALATEADRKERE